MSPPSSARAAVSARRSLFFSFLDRYASLAITVVSSMVLARLLTPTEIGVYAVTMSMLMLVSTVRDFGAGQYMLQERELTTERIRTVWGVQLAIGWLLALVVALAASPAANFYRDARVGDIMLLLAVNFAINPLGSITYSWLMREMRYDAVAVMRSTSTLIGAVVSIGLAAAGGGPISLAWGSLCMTLTNAAISIAYRPAGYPWMPGFREIRRVLAVGSTMTASSVFQTIASAAPEFLLGKLQGLAAAGFYSRANGLVAIFSRLVTDAIHTVALSLFAKDAREGRTSGAAFLRATAYVTALGWSFCIGVALLAHPLIRLLYGNQWGDAVDATRVLALGACAACLIPMCQAVVVGYGAVGTALRLSFICFALALATAALGASIGVVAMAVAAGLTSVAAASLWLREARRILAIRWPELWRAVAGSFGVAASALVLPALTVLAFGWTPVDVVAPLACASIGGVLGFLFGLRFTRHPLGDEVARAFNVLRRRLKSPD